MSAEGRPTLRSRFQAGRVLDDIRVLSEEVGPRTLATDGEAAAAAWITQRFEDLGLQSNQQEFDAPRILVENHRVTALAPMNEVVPSYPVLLSEPVMDGPVSGELIVVEGTRLGPEVRGKVVLWYCGDDPTTLLTRDVAKHRPRGILLAASNRGIGPKRETIPAESTHAPFPVPCFTIPWESAEEMVLRGVRRVELESMHTVEPGRSRNVVAEIPGASDEAGLVLVGAHYDSPHQLPGASDNASGVAMVLELARLFAERRPRRTLRFAAWGAEEAYYVGSRHYATTTALEDHLLCVNLDVLGFALGQDRCYALADPAVGHSIQTLSREVGVDLDMSVDPYGSDHEPLVAMGVPGVCFSREGPTFSAIHTEADTVDRLTEDSLQRTGELIYEFLARVIQAVHWPFERQVPNRFIEVIDARDRKLGLTPLGGSPGSTMRNARAGDSRVAAPCGIESSGDSRSGSHDPGESSADWIGKGSVL